MTEKNFEQILDELNKKGQNIPIFTRPISTYVDIGIHWENKSQKDLADNLPNKFYFIKNQKKYVGLVEDRTLDLHWYMQVSERNKGLLSKALREIILPHLSRIRHEQRITIDKDCIGQKNFESSLNLAKAVGFTISSERSGLFEAILDLKGYKRKHNRIKEVSEGISADRLVELRREVNSLATAFHQIEAEIEMKLGKSKYTRGMHQIIKQMKSYRIKLDNAVWDFNQDKSS